MKNSARNPKPKRQLTKTKTVKRTKSGADRPPQVWHLRLYVTHETPKSLAAIANLERICEGHVEYRYRIEVIDVLAQPQPSMRNRIRAVPTLVGRLPKPMREVIGDLYDTERMLLGLDLRPAD